MKPANFPGRKNERRISALSRLYGVISKTNSERRLEIAQTEIRNLGKRIVSPDAARANRTKKDRSARARLRA
jgi:hypothetical protein